MLIPSGTVNLLRALDLEGFTPEEGEKLFPEPDRNGASRQRARDMIAVARGHASRKSDFPSFTTGFNTVAFLENKKRFYREAFGVEVDTAMVLLPPLDQALGAGVLIAGDVTVEKSLGFIQSRTPRNLLYRYVADVDEYINPDTEAPRPDRPYAIWTAPAVEVTDQAPELAKMSYEDIFRLEPYVPTMNAREYWVMFAWYLWATGKPLDTKSVTLTDSLDSDGSVVRGDWRGDRACVYACYRRHSHLGIRARRVVLPLPKAA